ncbi:MAG TPA: hypothetical protein VLF66_18285, partial [Thermoanaerobaculia bacterium]|nr:hypothetical protein [Thermoanaerobaculia bacterium]
MRLPVVLLFLFTSGAVLPALPPGIGPAELVADLETVPRQASSDPGVSVELGGAVLFTARNDRQGLTLWRTDGTAEGTRELADLAPGSAPVGVSRPVLLNGRAALMVALGGRRRDLWVSDGTAAGTRLVAHLPESGDLPSSIPASVPVALGGRLYFSAHDPDLGTELWVSDGSPGGTHVLVDLCPGACSSLVYEAAAVGDRLHFTTLGAPGRLWVSDGTAAGTRVLDVCPGGCASPPGDLVAHGDLLLFRVDDGIHGLEPWVSDGTAAGTRLLADLSPGPGPSSANLVTGFFSLGGLLYFTAQTGEDGGTRIWRTDGTPEGTVPATELLDAGRDGLPDATVEAGERLFFSLEEPGPGGDSWDREVWVLDGPAQAPRRLAGFRLERRSTFRGLSLADGRLLFSAGTPDTGEELWTTDGTVAGTVPETDIRPGPADSFPSPLGRAGARAILAADDGVHGRELWASDGTAAGTVMVRNLRPAEASADPGHLIEHRGELYFTTGPQGPPAGDADPRASLLWRIAPGLAPELLIHSEARYAETVSSGSDLYFLPPLADTLRAVQPAHTFLVLPLVDLPPGLRAYGELTPAGDRLFFGSQGRGQELWVTDGTPPGTRRVADLRPTWFDRCASFPCTEGEPYYPRELTVAGARVYFLAQPGDAPELWSSDGTGGGTVRVPSPVVAPTPLVAAGG